MHIRALLTSALLVISMIGNADAAESVPTRWVEEFPKTDFSKASIPFSEILSGGPPRDGIPAIDSPRFAPASEVDELADREPVITVSFDGKGRAYPLRVLMWHEIVNDEFQGRPISVTYCPLCDAAVVFDRRLDGQVLDFGTTGRLRNSDLVMYDRQTESWWQQFLGEAIIGSQTGETLTMFPARVEAYARFKDRYPDGDVLIPSNSYARAYGTNPYRRYDSAARPFLYRGEMPENIPPMARVVRVGDQAWSLQLLREKGMVEAGDLQLSWEPGQSSALDTELIAKGREIGNVILQRRQPDGTLTDAVHDTTFAFAFKAFYPEGIIHIN